MEAYETEEQKLEALKKWWSENGTSAVVGALLAIAIVIGWNLWQAYRQNTLSQASALYDELQNALAADQFESIEKISDNLQQQYKSTPYADLALLIKAKSLVLQNQLEPAKKLLQQFIQETHRNELSHIARIRLVRLMLATGEYEQGLQLIAEVDTATSGGFAAGYDELTGDLYVALDRLGEARTAYQSALRSGGFTPLIQMKLDDIVAAELVESSEQ